MTVSAHGTNHIYAGASRHYATAHVRTVHPQRKPPGWMECPADEFLRLLSLHDAGKIDLLAMPEYANDDTEEPEPEELDAAPATSEGRHANGMALASIYQVIANAAAPMTARQVMQATGLKPNTVRSTLSKNDVFALITGDTYHKNKWTLRNRLEQEQEK